MWGILYILGNGSVTENPAICSTHTSLLKIQNHPKSLVILHKKSPQHFETEFDKSPIQHLSIQLKSTISPTCTNCTKLSNYYSSHTGITHEPYFKPLSRTRPKIPIYIEITHQIYHKISNQKSPKLPIKSTLLPLYSI